MINKLKSKFAWFLRSKIGKLMLVAIVLSMVATASATVYVFYYGTASVSVQSPDLKLYAGSDSSASCTVYPCAHTTISSTGDVATISMSFFAADTSFSPVPATYYTNVTTIHNSGTSAHSIKSVQITNIADPSSDLGTIAVYYCTTQTDFNASGLLVTPSNCVGSYSITSTTAGSVSGTFPVTIAPGATQYIEIVAFATSTATTGSVSFNIAVQWA
jgi:hypothetical protein